MEHLYCIVYLKFVNGPDKSYRWLQVLAVLQKVDVSIGLTDFSLVINWFRHG